MVKFIGRIFAVCAIVIIGFSVWGFNNGMTLDNYETYLEALRTNDLAFFESLAKETEQTQKVEDAEPKQTKPKKAKNRLLPLPKNPFSKIDRHARNVPASAEQDIPTLAAYLQEEAHSDLKKARAIYIWITDNVHYDDEAYNSGIYPRYTAEYVLQNQKAVCDGFSNMYVALGEEMGLEVEKVSGYSKGYGYQTGKKFNKPDHAWNVIKVDGVWKIMDATWGAGSGKNVNGKLVSKKGFDDYWFDVNPYEAIFNHYPENENYHLISPALSLLEFEQLPNISSSFFKLGFSGKDIYYEVLDHPDFEAPKTFRTSTYIELIQSPPTRTISLNQQYGFEFYIPRAYKMALINSKDDWTYFKSDEGKFKLKYSSEEMGPLKIGIQHEKTGQSFETILLYEVVRGDEVL